MLIKVEKDRISWEEIFLDPVFEEQEEENIVQNL